MSANVADGTIGGGCAGPFALVWAGTRQMRFAIAIRELKGLAVGFGCTSLVAAKGLRPPLLKMLVDAVVALVAGWLGDLSCSACRSRPKYGAAGSPSAAGCCCLAAGAAGTRGLVLGFGRG